MNALRRILGVAGGVLLGGALAWAPVAAFTDDMLWVTKAALAGVGFLIIMKLLPKRDVAADSKPDSSEPPEA